MKRRKFFAVISGLVPASLLARVRAPTVFPPEEILEIDEAGTVRSVGQIEQHATLQDITRCQLAWHYRKHPNWPCV